jgi:CMP-N,N'-diacetyllegionaminic acid synthase
MRILAVIPARGGSKGLLRKNIALLAGRPLIYYTIHAAQAAQSLDRVIVSTDDIEIASVCSDLGVEVLMRPAELSDDFATTRSVLLHVLEALASTGYYPEAVMTLQPTSPLRTALHIDEAAAIFASHPEADSLVSCAVVPHIYHPCSVMRLTDEGYLQHFMFSSQPIRRQDKIPAYARNGAAIYITRADRLDEYIFGGRLIPYIMSDKYSIDIDTIEDLKLAEKYFQDV